MLDQTSWKTCTEGALSVKQILQRLSTSSEIRWEIHTNYKQISKKKSIHIKQLSKVVHTLYFKLYMSRKLSKIIKFIMMVVYFRIAGEVSSKRWPSLLLIQGNYNFTKILGKHQICSLINLQTVTLKLIFTFQVLRAHILPLTNVAFNKSGSRYEKKM